MALAKPELFPDGTCGRALPVGELLQEFTFGQFSAVRVLGKGGEVQVVVGASRQDPEPPKRARSSASSGAGANVMRFAELLATDSAANGPPASPPPTLDLPPDQVAAVIASSRLVDNYGAWDVDLSPQVVAGLIAGKEVEVQTSSNGESRTLLLAPTASLINDPVPVEVPLPLYHFIPAAELPAYLADPWAEKQPGVRMSISLQESHVTALSNKGSTVVRFKSPDDELYEIYLTVKKAEKKDSDPILLPTGVGLGTTGTVTATLHEPPEIQTYSPSRLFGASDHEGVMLALYFEWKQSWTLTGFSRGRLLQSLALAPGEETTIELLTWDRQKKTLEQSSSTETEQSMEDEQKTQDTDEVLTELTKKDEFELKASASADVQYNGGTVQASASIAGGFVDTSNVDDITKTTTKVIKEGLQKSSAKVKTQRSSKVTETTETGTEERITRKVRNPNLCHTLNLDYYEILTHYAVKTSFNKPGMRFCATIPNPVAETKFERLFIRQHEGPLRDALLDRSLAPGFEAVRLLRARQVAQAELAKRAERRAPKQPPPGPPATIVPAAADLSVEERAANNYLKNLQNAAKKLMDDKLKPGLDRALQSIGAKQQPASDALDAGKRWLAQQLFLRSFSQLALELAELAKSSGTLDITEWGPRLQALMPDQASMPKPSQLHMEPQEVKEGVLSPAMWSPKGSQHVVNNWDWGWWWGEVRRFGLLEAEDAGVGSLVEQFAKIYRAYLESLDKKGVNEEGKKLIKDAQQAQDALSDEDRLENDFPMRDYALAEERAEVLELHLQEHKQHYSFALFRALHPQEQLSHIEQAMAKITTGFAPGFYQPRVISQIGSLLLVPLNHAVIPDAAKLLKVFQDHAEVPAEDDTVLLPSPGLTVDARLGRCSGCEEFIEESRKIELRRLAAEADSAEHEAARRAARITAKELGDPVVENAPLNVTVDQRA